MQRLKMIRWLFSYAKPLWFKMSGAILLGIISNLAVIAIPLLGTRQMLELLAGNSDRVTQTFGLMVLLGLIRGVARYLEQYLNHDIAFRLLATIRSHIYTIMRKLGPAKISGKKSGDLIATITTDVEQLEVFFAHTISPCFIALGTTLCTFSLMAQWSWLFAGILLSGHVLVGVVFPIWSYQRHQALGDQRQVAFVELNQTIFENVESVLDIQQFRLEHDRLALMTSSGKKMNQLYRKTLAQATTLQISSEWILMATSLAILTSGALLQLPFRVVVLGTILSLSSFGSVFALSGLGSALLTTFSSGQRLFKLVQEKPEVTFPANKSLAPAVEFTNLSVEHLDFTYPKANEKTLTDLTLAIRPGQMIGIGGASGSGKSTLLKLIQRYFDPQKGALQLNQQPLPNFSENELRQLEGVMEQQTFLFKDTLLNNILIGKPSASLEEVEVACSQAALTEWIASLPDGYQTEIGSQARSVSDGERQRIGLARLFLHNAPLLLLDEPTSNLDYLNEQLILQALAEHTANKTLVLVSHRNTTLQLVETQYTLAKGALINTSEPTNVC